MERRDFLGNFAVGATVAAGLTAATHSVSAQTQNTATDRNTLRAADFGAMGNGTADDTAAVQRAINEAHRIGGATIHMDGKSGRNFKFASPLNLDDKRGVRLSGMGQPNMGESSQLLFTGRTGPFISLRSAASVTLENLRITIRSPINGPLVATGHSNAKADTMYLVIDRCIFYAGTRDAENLLDLSLCIVSTIKNCQFLGGIGGITRGKGTANAIQLRDSIFAWQAEVAIRNAGESWLISGCTFEPLASGRGAALRQESGRTAWGLTFIGCWMGDASGGTWIDTTGGPVLGLSIIGNRIASTETAIKLGKGTQGVMISGNRIDAAVCIDFAGQYIYGASVVGNDLLAPVPIANLGNAIPHFVAGQYTTSNSISGVTNFGFATFTGDGGNRAGIQLAPQYPPAKPQDGDLWTTSDGLFIRLNGRTRRVVLQ